MHNFDFLEFDPNLVLPTAPPKSSYIRSLDTFVALTQRFADEWKLDVVQDTEAAEQLKVGYYPDKASFEPYVTHGFYERLPAAHGLTFPYTRDGTVTMLVISEMLNETELAQDTRTYLYGQGYNFYSRQGIFGVHRLRGKGRREVVLTDNELEVCRTPNAVAVQELCDYSLNLLDRRAKHIVLLSDNRNWLTKMMKLSKLGFDISVDSQHVLEYVAKQISDLALSGISEAKLARKAAKLLRCLTEVEQTAVVSAVAKFTGVRVPTALVRVDRPDYISETAYYEQVKSVLFTEITHATLTRDVVLLGLKSGAEQRLPIQPSAVAAVICPLFDVKEDLVQWSYNYFNGIPKSVSEAGPSRWAHNLAIAELILSILTRHADILE
jgi:hypothetical protein